MCAASPTPQTHTGVRTCDGAPFSSPPPSHNLYPSGILWLPLMPFVSPEDSFISQAESLPFWFSVIYGAIVHARGAVGSHSILLEEDQTLQSCQKSAQRRLSLVAECCVVTFTLAEPIFQVKTHLQFVVVVDIKPINWIKKIDMNISRGEKKSCGSFLRSF